MKILPVGAEMFHADGRKYITKLIVAFRDFAKPPKKGTSVPYTAPNTPHYGCNDDRAPNTPHYGCIDNSSEHSALLL